MRLPGSKKVKTILLIVFVILAICIIVKTAIDNRVIHI